MSVTEASAAARRAEKGVEEEEEERGREEREQRCEVEWKPSTYWQSAFRGGLCWQLLGRVLLDESSCPLSV